MEHVLDALNGQKTNCFLQSKTKKENKMTTEILKLDHEQIAVLPEAQERRDEILAKLVDVGSIGNAESQAWAVDVGLEARRFVNSIEASRVEVGRPILEITKRINSIAKTLSEPIELEMSRVGKAVSAFQRIEQERVAREAQLRRDEEERMMAIKAQAERDARQAQASMTSEQDLERAVQAEADAKQAAEAAYATILAPQPQAARAVGMALKTKLCWECEDVHKLYAAARHLVRLEPNKSAIQACVTATMKIDGLRVWEETQTQFRTGGQ